MDTSTNGLISEYKKNRNEIMNMINDLKSYVDQVKELLPKDNKDYRQQKYVFEQKIKTVTEFMKLIFDMRKEISKSIKDEIAFTNKLNLESDEKDIDIHMLVSKIDEELNQVNSKVELVSTGKNVIEKNSGVN